MCYKLVKINKVYKNVRNENNMSTVINRDRLVEKKLLIIKINITSTTH